MEHAQVISVLREMHLFKELDDAQLNRASRLFDEVRFEAGQTIFMAGGKADGFYIILEGEVALTHRINDQDAQIDVLVSGDFLGEEALLLNRPHPMTAKTVGPTTLLKADPRKFHELIVAFPQIQDDLYRIIQSRHFIHTHRFDWLNEDEVVYQVRRKHIAYLLVTLLAPASVCLIALMVALVGVAVIPPVLAQTAFLVLAGAFFLAGILWGVWNVFDWSNDYYIVTNQRVVWIEQIIGLYESRSEAPLNMIQAVNQNTTFLGRLLGYGDVIVTTYTSKVPLRHVGEPYQMVALIEEYWHRAVRSYQRADQEELVRSVRRILGKEEPAPVSPPKPARQEKSEGYQEPSFWETYFSNIFQMRFEEGNTITYRKHWLILIRKSWKPLTTMTLIVTALVIYSVVYYSKDLKFLSPTVLIAIGMMFIVLVIFPWWLYNYADWRNDIYQLTEKNIFDIERKPFGTEIRKSGSLDRILSLEHERPGFLGYLFNVGNVVINFGDAKFTFQGVYEPARIQQEIFSRVQQLRVQQQKMESARERQQMLRLLEIYHQNANSASNEKPAG